MSNRQSLRKKDEKGVGVPDAGGAAEPFHGTWPGGKVTSLRMALSAAPEEDTRVDMPTRVSLEETPLETEQY